MVKIPGQSDIWKCLTWHRRFLMGIWWDMIQKLRRQSWCILFKVGVKTGSFLASLHVRVTYRTNQGQWGLPRSLQERPKGPTTAKRVIFKGDGSLDSLFSRLCERLKLFWTFHMSGYLMEPFRDIEDIKGAVRNVKNSQKGPKWHWGHQNIKISAR